MAAISLVVVTWNSAGELGDLLRSAESNLKNFEFVVVDNASSDETRSILTSWRGPARILELDQNCGFAVACNIGVRHAEHDAVALLNPDTLVIDDSLEAMAAFALEDGALYGPEVLNQDGSRQPSASVMPGGWEVGLTAIIPAALMPPRLRVRCEPWRAASRIEVGWLTGACIVAAKDSLIELGPFDEGLHLYGEDIDLGLRARRRGIRSIFAPNVARIVHLGGRSASRRYSDRGTAQKVHTRRVVGRKHLGPLREGYDFSAQVTFHATRCAAKTLLARDSSREWHWLRTVFGHRALKPNEVGFPRGGDSKPARRRWWRGL